MKRTCSLHQTHVLEQQLTSRPEHWGVYGALLLAAAEQVLNHLLDLVMEHVPYMSVLSYQHTCDNVGLHTVMWDCCVV